MTTDGPKAIETHWGGYRFRSRLEARWAIFMHTLGVKFEYEKEGYELPLGEGMYPPCEDRTYHYLPDFWLPELDCFVEIKGVEPTDEESEKAYRLAWHTGKPVFMFVGECWLPDRSDDEHPMGWFPFHARSWRPEEPESDEPEQYFEVALVGPCNWVVCSWCGRAGISHHGNERELQCGCDRKINRYSWLQPHGATHSLPLTRAFLAARQARFEHGETPPR